MPTNNIKTIIPINCPHCNGGIFVEFVNKAPEFSTVFTLKDIETAKKDAKMRIECLSIDEKKKEEVLNWVNDETTIFSAGEVDEIINSLLIDQNEKIN